jgi:CheY-like chemotaxis protein
MCRSCHVLVIDDDAGDRQLAERTLSARGYPVQVAANGIEALQRIEEGGAPHVVLLDLMMPLMDGAQFLTALRERGLRETIRVVLLTGVVSRHVRTLLGVEGCLFKPYSVQDLVRTVEEHCPGTAAGRRRLGEA